MRNPPWGTRHNQTPEFTAISTGVVVLTAGQIQFPATQNPSADANTLDDYEEGTTTPTVTAATGTFTSVTGTVRYTKNGNRVEYNATITITTNGTAATEIIVPMPFTAAETTGASGTENGNAFGLTGFVSGANLRFRKYDGTYPGADGRTLQMFGHFRV